MNTPNIFDYATSELSQDAFFAWFLKWAEPEYSEYDIALHDCSVKVIKEFCKKNKLKEIRSVEIIKQWNHIDLWIVINESVNLIIEDKVKSKVHGNQLKTYKKYFKNNSTTSNFIYLKTSDITDSERNKANSNKYKLYDAETVYELIKECNSQNPIFVGFKDKLFNQLFSKYLLESLSKKKKFYDNPKLWSDNCIYYWFKKSLPTYYKKYLALDMWVEASDNRVRLFLHGKKDSKGTWIEDATEFGPLFNKITGNKTLEHFKKDQYYFYLEKTISVDKNNYKFVKETSRELLRILESITKI